MKPDHTGEEFMDSAWYWLRVVDIGWILVDIG